MQRVKEKEEVETVVAGMEMETVEHTEPAQDLEHPAHVDERERCGQRRRHDAEEGLGPHEVEYADHGGREAQQPGEQPQHAPPLRSPNA